MRKTFGGFKEVRTNLSLIPKLPGVYKWTNLNNGKVYIGKAVQLRKRINSYRYYIDLYSNSQDIYKVMNEEGFQNFKVDILEAYPKRSTFIDKLILEREAFWIRFYRATQKEFGYNICKYSIDRTGVKQSQSFIDKITEANTEMVHINRCRPVQQINMKTGEILAEFYSANHASICLVNHGNLRSKILEVAGGNSVRKSCHGYFWRFKPFFLNKDFPRRMKQKDVLDNFKEIFASTEKNNGFVDIRLLGKSLKRPMRRKYIYQYCPNTNCLLNEFSSSEEAVIFLFLYAKHANNLNRCALGVCKTSYGFMWRYVNNNAIH